MAITFLEERKVQRRYILIFLLVILITGWVVWRGLLVKEQPVFPSGVLKSVKKVEIDFKIFENPILQGLRPFEEIKTYEEEISGGEAIEKVGRANPFAPY